MHENIQPNINFGNESLKTLDDLSGVFNLFREQDPPNHMSELLQTENLQFNDILQNIQNVPGLEGAFNVMSGRVVNHTNDVYDNFEQKYAGQLSEGSLPLMRLLVLAHDLGKDRAEVKNKEFAEDRRQESDELKHSGVPQGIGMSGIQERHVVRRYNEAAADIFLTKMGVSDQAKGVMLAVIGEGIELARNDQENHDVALKEFAKKTLMNIDAAMQPTSGQVESLKTICKILAVSDNHCEFS